MVVKKKVNTPETKKSSLQAIVDYLVDNGMSDFGANMFIHTNLPVLGGDRSVLNCIQDGNWEQAWEVSEAYIAGDYY